MLHRRAILALFAVIVAALPLAPVVMAADNIVEAESLTLSVKNAGASYADSSASGKVALIIRSNAVASRAVSLPASSSITLRAKGQQCWGAPNATVSVDGQAVLNTPVSARSWTPYTVPVTIPAGNHTVAVAYTNDARFFGCDRALLVDSVAITPVATTPPPAAVNLAMGRGYIGGCGGAPLLSLSDTDLNRELTVARDAGMKYVRVDVDWSVVEPTKGNRNWTVIDRVVDGIVAKGMSPVGLVTYAPGWATKSAALHAPPADPNVFAAFAKDAATRYQGRIPAWEVWNEPNISQFWAPAPDASAYGQLLAATYQAIKTVDPTLFVLSAGLSPATNAGGNIAPVTFVQSLYSTGANHYLDAVGMHPYTFPALPNDPSTASWSAFQQMWQMRDVMVAGGDSAKKIWLTEFGAPTGTSAAAVSPDVQAQTVQIVLQAARDNTWMGPAFVYSLRDAGTDPADREQNFGLVKNDFTPKPALNAVKQFGVYP